MRLIVAAIVAFLATAQVAVASEFAPQDLPHTYGRLRWLCVVDVFCPVSQKAFDLIRQVMANDRSAEYLLGLTLLVGDDLPRNRDAGLAWIALAAERGDPDAARDVAGRLRNGEAIETKIAASLRSQADTGDRESMRALGPMYVFGRGVGQDPEAGLALLRRAAQKGSSGTETDLAQLYLDGAPGVEKSRPEALKWLAASAGHGNVQAMLNLGYMSLGESVETGFCWLVWAALLDQVQAQEKLSMVLAQGERDRNGGVIQPDLVQADLWFRLAARSPYHDNSQIRAMIEPHMTTAQINEAKRLFAGWRARTVQELKTMTIPLPPAAQGNCPPMG